MKAVTLRSLAVPIRVLCLKPGLLVGVDCESATSVMSVLTIAISLGSLPDWARPFGSMPWAPVSRNQHQCGGEAIINVGLIAGRRVLSARYRDIRSFAWLEVGTRTNPYRSPIRSGSRPGTRDDSKQPGIW
jgi:hypothetical protein